jgi:hypothetical protein
MQWLEKKAEARMRLNNYEHRNDLLVDCVIDELSGYFPGPPKVTPWLWGKAVRSKWAGAARESEVPHPAVLLSDNRCKEALSPLSSRAYPDFLFAALERAACAVLCKENRMELAAPPIST